jgi:peptidoglycan/xylan/chitin deacetylase (PgdA/CDA1 family)
VKPTVTKPTVTKPTVTKPTVTEPTVTEPTRTTPIPAWAKPWSRPVYSIDDILTRCPHTPMPGNAIMLTVDDGPDPTWTPKYLELFGKYNIRATFFMIGEHVQANPHLVKAVHSAGHVIGNHTWTHDEALPTRTLSRIRHELATTTNAIEDACGVVPRQFRAPGGVWGPRVFEVLAELHMMPICWDIDPRDWALPGTPAITQAMLAAGRHDIILCHDGGGNRSQTYAALKTVIPRLKSRGYEFVTLPSPAAL